jgi:hypothetical protein
MNTPNIIYVTVVNDKLIADAHPYTGEQFIKTSHLLQWLEQKHKEISERLEAQDDPVHWGQRNAFQQVIDKLNQV